MALVNHAKREINAKIVYYGNEKVGKATSLRYVYERIKSSLRGELKAVPASGSSLLFFDFSPFEQPVFGGYRLRLHIYTLQGKVDNPAAWKMTLKGADGLVIVTDASSSGTSESSESLLQLRDFLGSYGVGLNDIPFVFQLNKKDLSGEISKEAAMRDMGVPECSSCFTSAVKGEGVLETLSILSKLVIEKIGKRDDLLPKDILSSADIHDLSVVENNKMSKPVADHAFDSAAITGEGSVDSIVLPSQVPPTVFIPKVLLADEGMHIEGATVRIPLNVSRPGGFQRLVVTVTVSEE